MTSDEARVVQQIEDYSNDVTILTDYFCNNNCYEVIQRVWSGDYSAATCPCLLDYNTHFQQNTNETTLNSATAFLTWDDH